MPSIGTYIDTTIACVVLNQNLQIKEHSPVGTVVTEIELGEGYTVELEEEDTFKLNGSSLVIGRDVNFEQSRVLHIVTVININDNPPIFKQTVYTFIISELLAVNSPIGNEINAEDLDQDVLYYELSGLFQNATTFFRLSSETNPVILVNKRLDYDDYPIVNLLLTARDRKDPGDNSTLTGNASIVVNIADGDDKPPFFMPCTEISTKICINNGYTGSVNRTEVASGPLALIPGPLYAVDGDKGIGDPVEYAIISGNADNVFNLQRISGNITMNKAVATLGVLLLQVMASQINDPTKYSITSVAIEVKDKNAFPPTFEKSNYHGMIPSDPANGDFVLDLDNRNRPLVVFATDDDYADKQNPFLEYKIENSTAFRILRDGFIITNAVITTPGTVVFEVSATDSSTNEKTSTLVSVEVMAATTTVPTTTTMTTTTTTTTKPETTTSSLTSGTGTTTTLTPGTGSTTTTTTGTGTTTTSTPGTGTTTTTTKGTGTTKPPSPGTGTTTTTTRSTGTTTSPSSGTGTTTTTTKGTGTTKPPSPGTYTTTTTTIGTATTSNKIPDTGTTTTSSKGTGTTTTSTPGTGTTTTTTKSTGTTTTRTPGTGTGTTMSTAPNSKSSTTTGTGTPTSFTSKSIEPGATTIGASNTAIPRTDSSATSIPVADPSEKGTFYTVNDMAALGASLGVILAICLVLLAFFIHKQYGDTIKGKLRRGSDDFGNSTCNTEQLINEADDSVNDVSEFGGFSTEEPTSSSVTLATTAAVGSVPLQSDPADNRPSETEEQADDSDDKKVKSILTKELKEDVGYKSVWFREDASPEVVVIEGVEDGEADDYDDDAEEDFNNQQNDDDDDDEEDLDPTFNNAAANTSQNSIL
ncbi:PREDICTED: cadherin-related family member 5 [Nanorana parkeri]|uniref:cadherin-related family member 5 n=1 Tax=Nanorana parkeri TaxID=125878 RepID=UPI00085429CE|nr:PREDICTED: cadherin-related family member 5 [Nanorana parkeri]